MSLLGGATDIEPLRNYLLRRFLVRYVRGIGMIWVRSVFEYEQAFPPRFVMKHLEHGFIAVGLFLKINGIIRTRNNLKIARIFVRAFRASAPELSED